MIKRQIRDGNVYTEQGRFVNKILYLAGDRIVDGSEYIRIDCPEEIVEAEGCYVIPGLTDIHFHGCVGYDCCDGTEEAFRAMAEYELKQGVTTITPATMTMSEETLMQIAHAAAAFSGESGAVFCGLYMEGPFINPEKKGAQNGAYIRKPDIDLFERLQEASGGKFRTVVVAPEMEGSMEFIRALAGKVNISLAHTTADYETACLAFSCGASQLTHLYNAMMPYTHRAPGPIGAAADSKDCRAELICDGIHIHPAVVRTTFKMFGDDRIILISDSMSATGMQDGDYELGGQRVIVKGNRAVLEDGTIAGSATNLMDCMRIAVKEMGIPLESAVKCAAVNPAKAIGIYDQFGSLTPGKYGNVVILDRDLALRQVYRKGEAVL
ncbi:MAG: N-acetylglucosamine-6-phosphate deacetylase [Candidatus Choladocola sp.]|nr:N-acetylglucosamine-6-phosphate deacetylase [Candidatus Choladocola sp.]